ncbi:SIR2 family NAD-dependent protein deacylase [Limosilactobacillus difficilis]|uniref:NAD-dependent protein deacetylase n=1 Tax=Limosilactobacillus difficilis TaxID=2991838 RepID=UPI0024BA1CF2|nr:NAD-dependent protein deacetylase [Limosilactobacillus difficilis]
MQLELGIGANNQMLKAPMMEMVSQFPYWFFITMNLAKEINILPTIRKRSLALKGDIARNLAQLKAASPNDDFAAKVSQTNTFNYENLVMQTQLNYSSYYSIYAQGGTAVKLTEEKPLPYDQQIKLFAQKVKEADHIVIGGASGLSAAGGGDFYYKDTPSFYKYFGKFAKKYGIKGDFAGMKYPWKTREEFWGYLATFLYTTQHAPVRQPYKDLKKIIGDKDYFFLTTNQDTQAIKEFPEDKVAEIQGDHRFFQYSQQCTDDVWDAVQPVEDMVKAMDDGTAIPTEMIPKCLHCGAEAFPWVRGYGNFLEGTRYHQEYAKISQYLEKNMNDGKILFIELGVGRMTPMFIQEPFWALTKNLPQAYDVMVNRDFQFLPQEIEDKGVAIKGDINQVLDDVLVELAK